MKKVLFVLVVLVLAGNTVEAQTGWFQTQLNASGNMGYNLYATDSELFAATNNGVYSTADSGMPWFSRGPAGHYVYDVIKSGQYILVATNDGVYRSSDNGTTWLATNGSPTFVGTGQTIGPRLFAKNSTYVFAIAWAAGVFRSGDDGNSWQKLSVGTRTGYSGDIGGFSSCICAAGEKILIGVQVGSPETYYTLDNGMTWESRSMSAQMPGDLVFLRYADGQLFAGGFTGLHLSTDLGNSWTAQYSNTITPEGKMVGLGIFRDVVSYKQTLIAAVDFNSIQLSRDNGRSWTSYNEGLISDWTFSALAVRSPNVWALTRFFGNAYRCSLAELVTGVEKNSHVLPDEYSLHQNYPNPFNPGTTIGYSLPKTANVSLRVFNALGQEVASLVNEQKSAGTYQLQWNANVPSGIYFYRLQAGDASTGSARGFVETKKMILLK
jgi:hypothetical protein